MKLIILYGPPASGKLTVSMALSKLTGIPLFHNHYTTDIAKELFPVYSPGFYAINRGVRLFVFEQAAKHELPAVIYTWCYGAREDHDAYARKLLDIVGSDGEIVLVKLTCSREVLYERLQRPDRCKDGINKMTSAEALDEMLDEKGNYFATIPFGESFTINTEEFEPEEAAKRIAEHFDL